MMKAIQISQTGGPEVLQPIELPEPKAGSGEVVVRLRACGVNYIDTYHRSGLYPVALPTVIGEEGSGDVVEIGTGVSGFSVGDPVAYCGVSRSYAELVRVPADRLVRVPESLDHELAAALMLQGMTAHYLVNSTFSLRSGQSCLIHAAAGGVGLLLIQLAKRTGAYVIGTVSTEEKARLAAGAGADDIIRYDQEDFAPVVRRLTDGEGVDVVYDSVGHDTFERSLACLKPRGYLVLFGQSSGRVDPIDPGILSKSGSVFLTRPTLGNYIADRESLEARANEIMKLAIDGKLQVRIGVRFALDDAAAAHRSLEGRKTTGKVLLIP